MYLLDRLNEFSVSRNSVLRIAIPALRVGAKRAVEVKSNDDDLRKLYSNDLRSIIRSGHMESKTNTRGLSRRAREALYGDVA